MRSHVIELFAAEIRRYRHQYVVDATRAGVDADFPADVVRGLAFEAGLRWDTEHPTLAARLEESV